MNCRPDPSLYPATVPGKGRGMFSTRHLAADEVIETSPVIILSAEEHAHLNTTLLRHYMFKWRPEMPEAYCCIAFGYLAVYNHSYKANCVYEKDFQTKTMRIRTVRPIAAGEELTINYNGAWDDPSPVWWFETVGEAE